MNPTLKRRLEQLERRSAPRRIGTLADFYAALPDMPDSEIMAYANLTEDDIAFYASMNDIDYYPPDAV